MCATDVEMESTHLLLRPVTMETTTILMDALQHARSKLTALAMQPRLPAQDAEMETQKLSTLKHAMMVIMLLEMDALPHARSRPTTSATLQATHHNATDAEQES